MVKFLEVGLGARQLWQHLQLLVFQCQCTWQHGVSPGPFTVTWCPITSAVLQNAQERRARRGSACRQKRLRDDFVHLHLLVPHLKDEQRGALH